MNFPHYPCDEYLAWQRIVYDLESYEDLTSSDQVDLGYIQYKMRHHIGFGCKCEQCFNYFYNKAPPAPIEKVDKVAKSCIHYLFTFTVGPRVYDMLDTDKTVIEQNNQTFEDWTQDVEDVLKRYPSSSVEYAHERGEKGKRLHIHAHMVTNQYWDQSKFKKYTRKWGTVDIKKGEVDNGIHSYISKESVPIKLV